MSGELEQGGMEADGVAAALQHGTSQVVVQNDSRHRVPGREGTHMAAQEVLHAGIEKEAQEDLAREAQDSNEGHQWTTCPTNHHMSKVCPIDLSLFARQGTQTQISFRRRPWSVTSNDMAELALTAAIAALLHHRVQAARPQRRELGQSLVDEWQIRVDFRGAAQPLDARQAGLGQHPGDSVTVHAQLLGNRSDPPAFSMVIAQDLSLAFRGDRHDRVVLGEVG
jgi:hypothetical protein